MSFIFSSETRESIAALVSGDCWTISPVFAPILLFFTKSTPRGGYKTDIIFFTQDIEFTSELNRLDVRQNTSLQVPILFLTNLAYTK